jgi:hypothetical protein
MLNLLGPSSRFCDGVSRRSFLQIGSLALGGLSLPSLLKAEQTAGTSSRSRSNKSVIMVYLSGGMSHHDTFDMKPDAPGGIGGEFKPIATNVVGTQICEFLPRLSRMMDKVSLVRSLTGLRDEHSSWQTMTGYQQSQSQRESKPNVCSAISRVLGSRSAILPAYVDLFPTMQHRPYNIPGPGFVGPSHAGARVESENLSLLRLRDLQPAEFQGRQSLLRTMDELRRGVNDTTVQRMDTSYQQAYEVLTSSRLVEALDLDREPKSVRDRYGYGSSRHQGDGAPLWNDQLLMARRLVEAGVRCVSVAYGFWDTHGGNFRHLRQNLPVYDAGVSALVEDLHTRGMSDDVTVIVWGEFGRTPAINKDAGRDHWAPANTVLLAGGGMRGGQVIGATDKMGAYPTERPIHYRDILATVYNNMGVDPHTMVPDAFGRPTGLLPAESRTVAELCA